MDEFTRYEKQIAKELKDAERENKLWKKEFDSICIRRSEAKNHELNKNYYKSIELYLQNISVCQNSSRINKIHHFAHDINRVIILFGKTKENELLKNFLNELLTKYPTWFDADKWKSRLEKLKTKRL